MRILLILTAFLLAGCTMPDGSQVYLVSADDYYSQYAQGAFDRCLEEAAGNLAEYGVPPILPNLAAVVHTCEEAAYRQLREQGIPVKPTPAPGPAPSGT